MFDLIRSLPTRRLYRLSCSWPSRAIHPQLSLESYCHWPSQVHPWEHPWISRIRQTTDRGGWCYSARNVESDPWCSRLEICMSMCILCWIDHTLRYLISLLILAKEPICYSRSQTSNLNLIMSENIAFIKRDLWFLALNCPTLYSHRH